jgi:hypothetical protein
MAAGFVPGKPSGSRLAEGHPQGVVLRLAVARRILASGSGWVQVRSWFLRDELGWGCAGGAGARPYLGPRDAVRSRRHDDRWGGPAWVRPRRSFEAVRPRETRWAAASGMGDVGRGGWPRCIGLREGPPFHPHHRQGPAGIGA